MATEVSTTAKIIHAAERRMRDSGYHGFSFREIASDVGIKSSSVHHHFPTKDALGAAAARAYTDRFLETLGDPLVLPLPEALEHMVSLFRAALQRDTQMCLCGLLGAECAGLPASVQAEARYFFNRSISWLETVLDGEAENPLQEAQVFLATLEGALLVGHASDEDHLFENVTQALLGRYGVTQGA